MRGSLYDAIVSSGAAALGGTLNVSLFNGYKPATGATFNVLDSASHAGAFSNVLLPDLGGAHCVGIVRSFTTTGTLTVTATYYAGDFNRDGHVDAADILVGEKALTDLTGYESQYGVTTGTLSLIDDINGDGKFTAADLQDLLILLKTGGGSGDPVPEPTTLALLVLGSFGLFAWRRIAR